MIHCAGCARFTREPPQRFRISYETGGETLQSDDTTQVRILCFVYHSHSAPPEFCDDPIMSYVLANYGVHNEMLETRV